MRTNTIFYTSCFQPRTTLAIISITHANRKIKLDFLYLQYVKCILYGRELDSRSFEKIQSEIVKISDIQT